MKDKHKLKKQENFSQLKLIATISVSIVLRALLVFTGFHKTFARRVELASPVSSWFRVQECITLSDLRLSPYAGDICHQSPVFIVLFKHIKNYSWIFFSVVDILTGLILFHLCQVNSRKQMVDQESEKKYYSADSKVILIKENLGLPFIVLSVYLLNPFTLITCVAQSTTILDNFFVSLALLSICKGWLSMASIIVGVATHSSLYPVMLMVPVLLSTKIVQHQSFSCYKIFISCFWFFLTTIILLGASYKAHNSWDFVDAVYGFVLKAPDLTPNMGLFWYFFLEMFDHFRLFFLVVYQINIFIYTLPLAIVFRKQPLLLSYALLSLTTLFQSYSNFGHLSLPLALIPLWSHLFVYMRNVLLILGMFFFTSILAPCMWYLWIYAGMGNANFFYAVTLAYNTAQIFLLSDVMYAFLRHRFHLTNGIAPKSRDGSPGLVIMK